MHANGDLLWTHKIIHPGYYQELLAIEEILLATADSTSDDKFNNYAEFAKHLLSQKIPVDVAETWLSDPNRNLSRRNSI